MKINHAILHVFDFAACENTFAREEIAADDKTAKNYIVRLAFHQRLRDVDLVRVLVECLGVGQGELGNLINSTYNRHEIAWDERRPLH